MISSDSTDLETQRQSLPHRVSIEPFAAGQPTKTDSIVADHGLDCCCEVDVRIFLCFLPSLTCASSVRIRIAAGATAADAGIIPGEKS